MELVYNELFTIQLKLDTSLSTDFLIVPISEAVTNLNNHNMIFKKNNTGCFVAAAYTVNDLGQTKNLRPVYDMEKLTFLLILKNQDFFSHADLQSVPQDSVRIGRRFYYFSNLNDANIINGKVTEGQAILSEQAAVSSSDLWSVIPANYNFPVDTVQYNEVELYRINAGEADEKLTSVFVDGMPDASFVLPDNQSGAYKLNWKGAANRTEKVYSANEVVRLSFFGLIEIYIDSDVNTAILENKPVHYIIPFKKAA